MGRTAAGVRGMKFREGDRLVSMDVTHPEANLLVVTNEGFGKRVDPALFTPKNRAGLGVRCVKVNDKKGVVTGAMFVTDTDQVLLISNNGVVIRTRVGEISQQGRDATGVRVMNLASDDRVSAVARILDNDEDLNEAGEEFIDVDGELVSDDSEAVDSDEASTEPDEFDADESDTDESDTDESDTDEPDSI